MAQRGVYHLLPIYLCGCSERLTAQFMGQGLTCRWHYASLGIAMCKYMHWLDSDTAHWPPPMN